MTATMSIALEAQPLSDTDLRDAVEHLTGRSTPAVERRRHPRTMRMPVLISPTRAVETGAGRTSSSDRTFLVMADDMSRGGFAFDHAEMIPVGTDLWASLPSVAERPPTARATVARCVAAAAGGFTVGVRFDHDLNLTSPPW